ncbi:hypothetical protein ACOMHN_045266 [Nucella lapillus]
MTTGKAPGPDAIPAEVYKTGGETIRNQLTSLFQSMWKQEHLPQEFRDATTVHIYKRKGNRQSCDNHRHSWQDPGPPNVCPYQDMDLVVVRQPCVQAFTRLVKVWKPHCGYTRNWCVGYERRYTVTLAPSIPSAGHSHFHYACVSLGDER